MSTILVTGASGFVGSHIVPALLAAGHRVVALVRTPTAGELVLGRLPAAAAPAVETRIGDVTRPDTLGPALAGVDAVVHLVGDPARLPRRRGPAPGQHRRDAGRRRRDDGGRRPAARPHGRDGRRGRPGPPLRELEGQGRGARPRRPASTGRSSSRRSSSARATASSTSSPASSGCRRASSRCRATAKPASSRSTSDDVAAVVVRALADPTTIGGAFELGGPRYWTYREITREVLTALGKRRADRADAGRRSSGSSPGAAELVHIAVPGRDRPAAPAPARQHRAARRHPVDASASSRGRWRAPSATCGPGSATRRRPTG